MTKDKRSPLMPPESAKGSVDSSVRMLSELPDEGGPQEPAPAKPAPPETKVYHGETKPVVGVLIPLTGPATGTVFPLARFESIVGSGPDCTVHIESEYIAPRQLMIQHDAGRFAMMPLRGPNPVLLNGHVLEEATRLQDGDVIAVADTTLSFRTSVPPAPE